MKKVIKAQVYVPWTDEHDVSNKCEYINKKLGELQIYYDCFEGEYGNDNEHITCFEVQCEANTYTEAEKLYGLFKKLVHLYFEKKPKEIIKMKLERVM